MSKTATDTHDQFSFLCVRLMQENVNGQEFVVVFKGEKELMDVLFQWKWAR